MIARLLFLLTGVATAAPVIRALGWAVWGAGISITEYVSLLGSLILAASAAIPKRRFAARVALVGAVAVWSFYLPATVGVAAARLSDQELALTVLLWTPSATGLVFKAPMALSPPEVQRIRDTGITGVLSTYGDSSYGRGKKSRVILILQGPVAGASELRQPDAATVIYVQDGRRWRMFPPNARTLRRTIRIEPEAYDASQTSVMVELSTGARQGFGVWWRKPAPEGTIR